MSGSLVTEAHSLRFATGGLSLALTSMSALDVRAWPPPGAGVPVPACADTGTLTTRDAPDFPNPINSMGPRIPWDRCGRDSQRP
jgi:hypothetical protein